VRRALNRTLLALVGLVLFAVGGSVLVGALDLPRRCGFTPPSWWPYRGPHDVLLTGARRTHYRDQGWWWPAVIAALAVLAVVALWWLVAQLRDRRLGRVLIDDGEGGGVLLRGRALQDALAADAETLEGVAGAHVRLGGRRSVPVAYAALLLDGDAVPDAVVTALETRVLADARASTGLERLPAEVRMRGERHRARRVE
jgi:hypothetical protein